MQDGRALASVCRVPCGSRVGGVRSSVGRRVAPPLCEHGYLPGTSFVFDLCSSTSGLARLAPLTMPPKKRASSPASSRASSRASAPPSTAAPAPAPAIAALVPEEAAQPAAAEATPPAPLAAEESPAAQVTEDATESPLAPATSPAAAPATAAPAAAAPTAAAPASATPAAAVPSPEINIKKEKKDGKQLSARAPSPKASPGKKKETKKEKSAREEKSARKADREKLTKGLGTVVRQASSPSSPAAGDGGGEGGVEGDDGSPGGGGGGGGGGSTAMVVTKKKKPSQHPKWDVDYPGKDVTYDAYLARPFEAGWGDSRSLPPVMSREKPLSARSNELWDTTPLNSSRSSVALPSYRLSDYQSPATTPMLMEAAARRAPSRHHLSPRLRPKDGFVSDAYLAYVAKRELGARRACARMHMQSKGRCRCTCTCTAHASPAQARKGLDARAWGLGAAAWCVCVYGSTA